MDKKLHHIAIATDDFEKGVEIFKEVLGLPFKGVEDVHAQGTKVGVFEAGESYIEVITPLFEGTPLDRFLKRRGGGLHLHHLCLVVDDLEKVGEELAGKGIRFTSETVQEGAMGSKVLFIHPSSMNGVLVELKEEKKG